MEIDQTILADALKFMEKLLPDDGWENINTADGITTQRKFLPNSSIACFRSHACIDKPINELMDFVWQVYSNFDSVKRYDPEVEQYQIIKEFDCDTRLCYQVNKLPWPIWSRDMVYMQHRVNNCIVMYSVDVDSVPRRDDVYVRAMVNISAYVFEKTQAGTMVYRIAHVDPSGNIPAGVVNSYANKTRNLISHFRKLN